ncbi:hypothetical protein CcrColossus_gp290 [Caulobacter phage CcrColossus]|uniref:Uncharacterized protein n=1 Tax=Caulobacter phage CcrColossus TaxID=1211640 RepID=K4JUX6_9CAUD|nr:hypothetical protein CcrColossus_gp290 [Caulobacter phage CcrColossus]AFU88160.1 hypothetical protein CcrColossus_gp290 [Caulobacter phage CcrColossus]
MIRPGDLVLIGDITDLTMKTGRVVIATDLGIKIEPYKHTSGQVLGDHALLLFEESKPVRVIPTLDAARYLYHMRREWLAEVARLNKSFDARVDAWIGAAR